jgi:hypothetical protein
VREVVVTLPDELVKVGRLTLAEEQIEYFQYLVYNAKNRRPRPHAYGWIAHVYHERYGEYPPESWKELPVVDKPSLSAMLYFQQRGRKRKLADSGIQPLDIEATRNR